MNDKCNAVPVEPLHILNVIGGVAIYSNADGSYLKFTSKLDVCTDGSGPSHGDKFYQPSTAYYNGGKYLNADKDQYIVIPPQVRSGVKPIVMGCQARLTRISTKQVEIALTGEIGPKNKAGEAAICLAQKVNAKVNAQIGDSRHDYVYELWPGIPAIVGEQSYKLEPAPAAKKA